MTEMGKRRTRRSLLAVLAVALVAAVGFAPQQARALNEETVATVDGDEYENINDAINDANGRTVKIESDLELDVWINVPSGISTTIDLAGHTISDAAGSKTIAILNISEGASLTIVDSAEGGAISAQRGAKPAISMYGTLCLQSGAVSSNEDYGIETWGTNALVGISGGTVNGATNGIYLKGGCTANISGGTVSGGQDGIHALANASLNISGGSVQSSDESGVYGALWLEGAKATLSGDAQLLGPTGVYLTNSGQKNSSSAAHADFTMNGGSIKCDYHAIQGNNLYSAQCSATINDGEIEVGQDSAAIFWPMEGNLTVAGGSITGGNAIEAKMGTINITGGILRGTGDYGFTYSRNGSASDGSAVKIVGQLYGGSEGQFINNPNLTVNVTGGTLESAAGNAMTVYADGVESAYSGGDLTASVTVSATAKLTPAENYDALRATSVSEFGLSDAGVQTGNTTINSPELAAAAVIATGQTQTGENSSQNGNTLYTSVARAIASATADDVAPDTGTTITFLRDVNEDITVPEGTDVTLDLANHTLSGSVVNNGTLKMGNGTFEGQTSGKEVTTDENLTTVVAKVGDKGYSTVQAAIDNATNGQTVTLVANVTESVNIPANKTLTLDLNGFTLTNEDGDHTINNYGVLTINDSAGGGAVDNVSHGRAALYNYADATAVLNGGTFKRSKETGSAGNVGGGNSWYTIRNKGMMTLNSGVTVESLLANGSLSKFSSVICNGFNSSEVASEYKGKSPTLIIDGATIRGGLYVKNDYHGTLEMRSGDVRGSSAGIFNYADATISGGTVSVDLPDRGAVWNYAETASDVTTIPTLKITGGTIDGSGEGQMAVRQSVDGSGVEPGTVTVSGGEFRGSITTDSSIPTGTNANISISGGSFSVEPAEDYIVQGSGLTKNPDGSFGVHEHELTEVVAKDPTCTEAGNTRYWKCKVCDELFLDANGAEPTTADAVTLPAKGHSLAHIEAVPATGTTDGNTEYWECTVCHKYFSDEDGKNEIDPAAVIVPAIKHTVTIVYGHGLANGTMQVPDGAVLSELEAPSYPGYTFVGWFTTRNADDTVEDEYDFTTPVTEDLTLYAGWVKDGEPGKTPTTPGTDADKGGEKAEALAQTSDPTTFLPAIVAGAAGVTTIAGAVVLRKRQR